MESIIDNYTMFVDLLTIILTIIGISVSIGFFGVYKFLAREIQRKALAIAKVQIQMAKATLYIDHGYMYWTDYEVSNSEDEIKAKYLDQAIAETKKGLEIIQYLNVDTNNLISKEEILCYAMNNLSFYYFTQSNYEQENGNKKLAEEYAKYVYDKIIMFPEYREEWTDTYNKVVLRL